VGGDRHRRRAPRLFAPNLPEPTAQQGDDFLLNLRIVQQTQQRLFESFILLCLVDPVFSVGSILHRTIMSWGSSAKRPSAVMPQKSGERLASALCSHTDTSIRRIRSLDVKNSSEWQFLAPLVFVCRLILHSSQNTSAVRMAGRNWDQGETGR
jgi:hypothetical protein